MVLKDLRVGVPKAKVASKPPTGWSTAIGPAKAPRDTAKSKSVCVGQQ